MKDYEYKNLINEYDRFYRQNRGEQKDYLKRLFAYVEKLDREEINNNKDLTEENINHRVRLLKIASLCLGLHPEFLVKLNNETAMLATHLDSMSEGTSELFKSILTKIEKLTGETEN